MPSKKNSREQWNFKCFEHWGRCQKKSTPRKILWFPENLGNHVCGLPLLVLRFVPDTAFGLGSSPVSLHVPCPWICPVTPSSPLAINLGISRPRHYTLGVQKLMNLLVIRGSQRVVPPGADFGGKTTILKTTQKLV